MLKDLERKVIELKDAEDRLNERKAMLDEEKNEFETQKLIFKEKMLSERAEMNKKVQAEFEKLKNIQNDLDMERSLLKDVSF